MARNNIQPKQGNGPWPWIAATALIVAATVIIINVISNRPTDPDPPENDDYDGVCFVAGNVANSPVPDFSKASKYVKAVLAATETNETPNICMYSAAAEPYVIELNGIKPKAGSSSGLDSQEKSIVSSINKAAKASPTKSGANYFDAIREAAGYLKSNGSVNPLVVVYGSGLSDSGVLNFAFDGNLLSDNVQKTKYITNKLAINDVAKNTFSGVAVEWYGAGKVVKENNQEQLNPDNERKVKEVYEEALSYIGISIDIDNSYHDTDVTDKAKSVEGALMVNPTREPGAIKTGFKLHLDEKHAKFNPNEATLVSRENVIAELTSFAEDFNADTSLKLKITGYHAKCGGGSDEALSLRRANTIKDILVNSLGVSASRITTHGVGGPQDDREEGQCSTSPIAAEHRVVIIETY